MRTGGQGCGTTGEQGCGTTGGQGCGTTGGQGCGTLISLMRKSKFEPGESANVQCTSHGDEIAFNTVRVKLG